MSKRRQFSRRKRNAPANRPSPQAKQWVAALAALGNEQWAEAIDRFKKFMQAMDNPLERLPIYHNLAACYLEMGLYDEALVIWDEIAALMAENPDMQFGRAITCGCAGRLAEAIQSLEQFRQLEPTKAQQLGLDEMIDDLQQEMRGERPSGNFLYQHLEAQLETNIDMGDFDLVERKARRLIGIINERPEGHFALGLALLRQKQPAAALTSFLAAHALEPQYVPTLYNIGYCYMETNQPEEALIWLKRALERDKTYTPALQKMGQVHLQWNQTEEAVAFWRRALTIQPDYEPAQQALYEAGAGPKPEASPAPITVQLQRYMPIVKGRMIKPRVYRSGSVTLTLDPEVGFVLEDAENARNGTVYAGGPFSVARMEATDVRHFIGVLKLLVRQANEYTCRDMAILAYYSDEPPFSYQLAMKDGELVGNGNGRLFSDKIPSHLKVRVDSDLESPYGSPFNGYFIYLAQGGRPGVAAMTLGLLAE